MYEVSKFPTSSSILVIGCHFYYNHSGGYAVVSNSGLISCFPNDWWCWRSFLVFIGHSYIFFGEMYIQILRLFYNWVIFLLLACKSPLYVLSTGLLSDTVYTNIFSQYIGYLCTFLMTFEAKIFSFEKVPLVNPPFYQLCIWYHI